MLRTWHHSMQLRDRTSTLSVYSTFSQPIRGKSCLHVQAFFLLASGNSKVSVAPRKILRDAGQDNVHFSTSTVSRGIQPLGRKPSRISYSIASTHIVRRFRTVQLRIRFPTSYVFPSSDKAPGSMAWSFHGVSKLFECWCQQTVRHAGFGFYKVASSRIPWSMIMI